MQGLRGKAAIVTGLANGMGEAVARALAGYGTRVVIADIDVDRAARVSSEIASAGGGAVSIPTDIGDEAQVKGIGRAPHGRAGQDRHSGQQCRRPQVTATDPGVIQLSTEVLDGTLRVNVLGSFWCCTLSSPMVGCNQPYRHWPTPGSTAPPETSGEQSRHLDNHDQ